MDITQFHDRLISKADEFLSNSRTAAGLEKLTIFIIFHYLLKSYKLFKGINLLYKARLETDAQILLRSLFEVYCLSRYIADDLSDINRVEDCIIRSIIAEKKQNSAIKNLDVFNFQTIDDDDIRKQVINKAQKIEQKYEVTTKDYKEAINRLQKSPDYSGLKEADIVKNFETKMRLGSIVDSLNNKYKNAPNMDKNLMKKYYDMVIRDLSASVHCNDFRRHVKKDNVGGWVFYKEDYDLHSNLILKMSANLFIQVMKIANEILKLQKEIVISELETEYNNMV